MMHKVEESLNDLDDDDSDIKTKSISWSHLSSKNKQEIAQFEPLVKDLVQKIRLASASASAPETKSGMANTGGSTLSTRRPRTLRSTGRNRSASDPRYACWFWGLCVLGSSPPVSRTCGGSFDNTDAACDAVRSFSGGGQCHTREGAFRVAAVAPQVTEAQQAAIAAAL